MPKFSIITCTYNSEDFLQKNIDSISSQSYTDFEHLFIDGKSSDNTTGIIKKYQEKLGEKVRLVSKPAKWISNAMNTGIQEASGEYLIHLHSDDKLHNPKVLEHVANFLEKHKDLDRIYAKANVVEKDGKTSIGIFPNRKIFQRNSSQRLGKQLLKYFNYIPHQTVFIKKTVFKKFGDFDETIASGMDPDMRLRIKNKTKWRFLDTIVCDYMIRDDAQSSSAKNKNKNRNNLKKVVKRHTNCLEFALFIVFRKALNLIAKNTTR